jgi:hypothetical protein
MSGLSNCAKVNRDADISAFYNARYAVSHFSVL